jgi:hypothetical protein
VAGRVTQCARIFLQRRVGEAADVVWLCTPASRAIEIKDGLTHLFQKPAKAPFIDRTQQQSADLMSVSAAAAAALPRNCSKPSLPWTILAAPLPPNAARLRGQPPSRCAQHVTGTRVIPGPGLALRTEGIVMRRLLLLGAGGLRECVWTRRIIRCRARFGRLRSPSLTITCVQHTAAVAILIGTTSGKIYYIRSHPRPLDT